jgi:hypothetical protein
MLHRRVKLQRLLQRRNRGAKLTQPELRQPQIKARVRILRREANNGAKVFQRLEIIALAVLDNTFGVL